MVNVAQNGWYPLVNEHSELERSTIVSWENPLFLWSFSIAMLNYQRVDFSWKIYENMG